MDYRKNDGRYFVRLDPDDEIIATLTQLCRDEGITAGVIQGIGGCKSATVGVFDLEKKDYDRTEKNGLLEMVSLDGNVSLRDGAPFLHLHAAFAYSDAGEVKTLSGHLLSAVIGLTGEIILTPSTVSIKRKYIEELGIRIWNFE